MAFSVALQHFLLCIALLVVIRSNAFKKSEANEPVPAPLTSPSPESSYDPMTLFNLSIQATKNELSIASSAFSEHGDVSRALINIANDNIVQMMLQSCRELIDIAQYNLDRVVLTNESLENVERREDFRTWVSGVRSLLEICKEESGYTFDVVKRVVTEQLDNSTTAASISLSIIAKFDQQMRLFHPEKAGSSKQASEWPPSWLSSEDKILLNDPLNVVPDLIVAKDGSGNYRTISDALKAVPSNSNKRFTIYVKKGVYLENARVSMDKLNVYMYGDGPDLTIVSSNRSNMTGYFVIQSAALGVDGNGFIGVNMGFQNTAGAVAGQAVALQSTADKSVFYNCKMEGYQDTLFATINRQFYRECSISGTVDFIFGYAAVVIQNSDIYARKPLPGQQNVITAGFKDHPGSVSAISIQNCHIQTLENLTGVQTFLGRPLTNYATSIFMESRLENLIDPQGWNVVKDAPSSNIYFGEYKNTGPGADTMKRIKLKGVMPNLSANEANKFTVRSLIGGTQWLQATGVPYQPGL